MFISKNFDKIFRSTLINSSTFFRGHRRVSFFSYRGREFKLLMKIFQTKLEFLSLGFSIPATQELSFAFLRLLNFLDKILFNENEVPTFQKCTLKKFTLIKKLKVLSSEKKTTINLCIYHSSFTCPLGFLSNKTQARFFYQ